MCIRDSYRGVVTYVRVVDGKLSHRERIKMMSTGAVHEMLCLLYTSDAADERSSVDLGGRRIIKTKPSERLVEVSTTVQPKDTLQT